MKLILVKILELLRKVVPLFNKKETKTSITDVVPSNVKINTVSGTDVSNISDVMPSKFEIMEIWLNGCFFSQ